MLSKAKTLKGYKLQAKDGEIGKVKEFYFDDKHWTVRYLVAETGNWLSSRKVLISPYALTKVDRDTGLLTVDLTKKQIENSPSLDSDEPVSKQFEQDYYGYYDWPQYWGGSYGWGYYPYIERNRDQWRNLAPFESTWDPHLRSTNDVDGHNIEATDGEVGHVEDFLIDTDTWAIRYLVVDTRNWLPGKKVLISPLWVERVSWEESRVYLNLSRADIKSSPAFTQESLVTRNFEEGLFGHYNRKGYWVERKIA